MGLLVPVIHEDRVSGPDEAGALYQALGVAVVQLDGIRTRAADRLERLLQGIAPDTDSTINFERGTLGEGALNALHELTHAGAWYLDLGTSDARLRVWRTHSWMHGKLPAAGPEAVGRALSAAIGRPVEVGVGVTMVDDTTVTIDPSAVSPVDVRTPHAEIVFQLFAALSNVSQYSGHMTSPNQAALEQLLPFCRATDPEIRASLALEPMASARLAHDFGDCELEWQADGTIVNLPSGEIMTYLVAPFSKEDELPWRDSIDRALRKARAPAGPEDAGAR